MPAIYIQGRPLSKDMSESLVVPMPELPVSRVPTTTVPTPTSVPPHPLRPFLVGGTVLEGVGSGDASVGRAGPHPLVPRVGRCAPARSSSVSWGRRDSVPVCVLCVESPGPEAENLPVNVFSQERSLK